MGRSKAWLPFGPERLIERIVRIVGEVAAPVVVVAAPGQDLPPLSPRVAIVRDEVGKRGPLQGLAAGLAAQGDAAPFVFATAVDCPFLVPAWIGRLAGLIGDADLAIPRVDGKLQPLAALYRPGRVLPAVHGMLDACRFRVSDLVGMVHTREVGADELRDVDPDFATITSLNTPEEYRDALCRAGFDVGP